MKDSNQYVISVGLPNVERVKSGLEVKVVWQYTHVGQTLHRLKDLCFLPLTGKRDRLTAVLQQDRTGVCVCVCVRACVRACVCSKVTIYICLLGVHFVHILLTNCVA